MSDIRTSAFLAHALVGLMLCGCGNDTGADDSGPGSSSTSDLSAGPTSEPESSSTTQDTGPSPQSTTGTTGGGTATSDPDTGSSSESGDTGGLVDDGPVGWASVAGRGVRTTTGGAAGRTVTVTTLDELEMYAGAEEPYVIQLSGTITGSVRVRSNKTLEGLPGAELVGGLAIIGEDDGFVSNIIVRDLTVRMDNCPGDGCSSDDAVTVYRAHHIWVDHCDISDGDDGNLDITAESDFVTVSWCRFSYSNDSGGHRFSNLIGASDGATEDQDDLAVTLHHNWWTANVSERMPRVRFGPVHVFNNYYTPTDALYCMRAGFEADLRIENNYFEGVSNPFDAGNTAPSAQVLATGNEFSPMPIPEPDQGDVFDPPYAYSLDAASDVPAVVMAGVGPR
ncbi:MAG: pectate lyase family protein [Nannocystales bacterium]